MMHRISGYQAKYASWSFKTRDRKLATSRKRSHTVGYFFTMKNNSVKMCRNLVLFSKTFIKDK